ncbi:hypothetical protein ACRAWF_27095 [Streptomyces sp. L7]
MNGTTGEWFLPDPRGAPPGRRDRGHRALRADTSGHRLRRDAPPPSPPRFGEHARSIGADGILTTPPPYVHPSQDEIHAFYATLADAVDPAAHGLQLAARHRRRHHGRHPGQARPNSTPWWPSRTAPATS